MLEQGRRERLRVCEVTFKKKYIFQGVEERKCMQDGIDIFFLMFFFVSFIL